MEVGDWMTGFFQPLAFYPSNPLPRRLTDAGDHSLQRQLAEADSAEAEPAKKRARTPTPAAPVVDSHLELRLPLALFDHCLSGHRETLVEKLLIDWRTETGRLEEPASSSPLAL